MRNVPETVTHDGIEYEVKELFIACTAFGSYENKITIPDSVSFIEIAKYYKDRFGNRPFPPEKCCPSQDFGVEVSENNLFYSSIDGSLYTKDNSRLIQLSASRGSVAHMPASVRMIDKGSLYGNYRGIFIDGPLEEFPRTLSAVNE